MGGIGMGDVGGLGVSDASGMSVGDVAGTSENSGLGGVAGSAVGAAATAAAAEQSGITTAMNAVKNYAMNPTTIGRTLGMAAFGIPGAIVGSMIGSNIGRGVTGPSDDTQETESVQTSAPNTSNTGGGITTIQSYAPLYNTNTGDNTSDAMRIRLENLLQVPTTKTVFQNPDINSLFNYTLADLTNLRRI
jgi:hypothetical protein